MAAPAPDKSFWRSLFGTKEEAIEAVAVVLGLKAAWSWIDKKLGRR